MSVTTWFVTGASRGFGRELTGQLLARGHRVAATLRRPEQLNDLAGRHQDRLWVRALDVTDTGQMRRVVAEAFTDLGRVDVVVSNAGFGVFGAAEDLTDAQVEAMIATNLTASIQLARAVVPYLRGQGGGRLLQLSSMGGHIAFPAFSMYHATKWGIEGFYESLAVEVEPFGIRTMLVEPGFFRSELLAPESTKFAEPSIDDYAERTKQTVAGWKSMNGLQSGDPAKLAGALVQLASQDEPPLRFAAGADAVGALEQKARDLLAQASAYRELSSSLAHDDA
ncbi:MAG TPA: SDR family oxidoreductase [Streptosporangiaceae bacterium]|nr:SDR family oxidoreductase [Streptosporangiaceae bacterium]